MSGPRPASIEIIRDEHLAISAVLFLLRQTAREAERRPASADFALLWAILDYIVAYPDRWHHPKEDGFLFAALRGRSTRADALIARLRQEHADGHPMIGELKLQLAAFESGAAPQAFCAAAEAYVRFEWAHMRCEEDELLPLAESLLDAPEWARIDAAFRENDNPLSGLHPRDDAQTLYQRIMALAPPVSRSAR